MSNASLLLVDDEPFNLEILSLYLEGDHYKIATANDGERAWELLCSHPDRFDVVLLDWRMPRKDGLEVLHDMKKHPDLSAIPVIMQTAAASSQDVIDGLEAGSYYYLTKPYQKELLVPIVRGAVSDSLRYKTLQKNLSHGSRTMSFLKTARFQVQTLAEAQSLAATLANLCPNPGKVALGLTELMVNAIEHGNLGIGYAEKSRLMESGAWLEEVARRQALGENRDKFVEVDVQREAFAVRIRITDRGPGFAWREYLHMSPRRAFHSHGRGIAMANLLNLEQLEYLEPGNSVVVTIKALTH